MEYLRMMIDVDMMMRRRRERENKKGKVIGKIVVYHLYIRINCIFSMRFIYD